MNYGYTCANWTKEEKVELADSITDLLTVICGDQEHRRPYVEVDRLYPGVRIRSLTHQDPHVIDTITKGADALYEIQCLTRLEHAILECGSSG